MANLKLFSVGLRIALLVGSTGWAGAAPADDLIAGAKKEGVIEFYGPSTLGPEGAKDLAVAFNKKYGLNITLNFNASGNMTRDIGKVVGLSASGQPPEWDIMVVTDSHHGSLWFRKLHKTFDYKSLGVDPKIIVYDNGAISIANQFALPAYNKKILPAKDVPKRWEDLLDAKWKGGKLGVTSSVHHFARLAAGPWGEEKTNDFVKKMAAMQPTLSRAGEMAQRLLLGEVLISATMQDSQLHESAQQGAPLFFAEDVQPVVSPEYHVGVLKGAPHPNVGHLFTVFMSTKEGQQLWEKHTGHSSAYVPGTKAYKFAQGKNVVYMKQEQAQLVDKLTRQYGKVFGFDN
jgi:ABC-type Fe3+ transport system substrate-binding protein